MPTKIRIGRPRNLDEGDRVVFKAGGENMRGTVTAYREKGHLRIKGVDEKQYTTNKNENGCFVDKTDIQYEPFGIFVFDTALDDTDTTFRQSAVFWKEFCDASGWSFQYERVHSISDLKYFLEERLIDQSVLLFNGHGSKDLGWKLSNGELLNDQIIDFKPNNFNRNKLVIFSACEIGNNARLMQGLKNLFCAEALFAYNCSVYENVCFLIESLLLTYINDDYKAGKLVEHYAAVCAGTDRLKTINRDNARIHPLVIC